VSYALGIGVECRLNDRFLPSGVVARFPPAARSNLRDAANAFLAGALAPKPGGVAINLQFRGDFQILPSLGGRSTKRGSVKRPSDLLQRRRSAQPSAKLVLVGRTEGQPRLNLGVAAG
jgi:hypothetical protein